MDSYISPDRRKSHAIREISSEFQSTNRAGRAQVGDGIGAYCRRQGISETQFYQWQKQILDNADAFFTRQTKNADKKITQLEEELRRKDQIIAVVTEEALELKKKLTR